MRRDLNKGKIALEDIFDLNYRNSICVFKASGKELRKMMEFNINQSGGDRCQVSGFNISCKMGAELEDNHILECSLGPKTEYLVATSNYLAERAKKFFGKEVEYTDTGLQVNQAMVQWFKKFKAIGETEPRIRVIRDKEAEAE